MSKFKISIRYIKCDWGSGKQTWRPAPIELNSKLYKMPHKLVLRKITKKAVKKYWLKGGGLKAY